MPTHYQGNIDRGLIRHQLASFVSLWRQRIEGWDDRQRGRAEKANAQTFWSDLLRRFDVIPERIDLFERDAARASTGGRGSIDVFWSGVFLGEAKSPGKDLDAAVRQALDYLSGGSIGQHEWPKYVVVTDFERFRVEKLGDDPWAVEFPLDEIVDHVDQLMFLAGHDTVTKREQENASIQASAVMARLYTAMVGDEVDVAVGDNAPRNPEDEDEAVQRASVFLTRLLFLLYGDDAGLWESDLFYRFVLHDTTPDSLGPQLRSLFEVLNTPESKRRHIPASLARFPYINGALFAESAPPEYFTPAMRDALLAACRFRWTRISPAVFGSMFQMVKSRQARREGGEHYTTEANILKTIGPLFVDELRAEADRLIKNKSTTLKQLRDFQDRLASHLFLDPACGSGNFLNLAYAQLRDIETDVIVALRERRATTDLAIDATLDTKVTIDQFHGIEINWWPARIAETAMFLVDHQANRRLALATGNAPDRLPIVITAHIHHRNALEGDWADFLPIPVGRTYVFGNPPFLGHETRAPEQAQELREAWRREDIGRLDYVTAWYAKSLDLFSDRPGEFAYVSTNSVSQGDQVARLFAPLFTAGWSIKFAHRTFAWTSEAPNQAAVHCVIIGFTKDPTVKPKLWDYATPKGPPTPQPVTQQINAYLIDGPNVLVERRSDPISPQLPPVTMGSMPRDDGNLIVEEADYPAVAADPIAAKYLRELRGSREILRNLSRWCLWLVDLDPDDVKRSQILKERTSKVAAFRAKSPAASTREMALTPHLFGQRAQPTVDYLAIPKVASASRHYVTAKRFSSEVITSDLAYTAPDPDGLQFALISSSMFITWQRAVGGRLKSDLRFSNTLTWNTFPVPSLTADRRAAIITAGQKVLAARALHPGWSLAKAYNPLAMDPTLVKAHDALDREVDKAFGAAKRLTSERQRLELLFASYAELTKVDVPQPQPVP